MSARPDTSDYRSLFLDDTPLMDVRAPVEFTRGSFPQALNAPLMNDDERHQVGICYKQKGQDKAIELGHQLVKDDVKAARVDAWQRFVASNPAGYLFCFRGGLRSRLTQQWLHEAGIDYPLVKGGYKALRRFLIDELDAQISRHDFVVVSGRTGTGKTRLLLDLPNPIDLEGMANHRGSSFGRQITPQPTQIDFENRLAIALLKSGHRNAGPAFVEDESRLIGQCYVPDALRQRMAEAPLMILERPMHERIGIIREDYVVDMLAAYRERDGDEAGWLNFRDYLLSAMDRIRKRLGGERHRELRTSLSDALDRQCRYDDLSGHDHWIESLLTNYYDPMYDYQLSQKSRRIVVRGDHQTVSAFAVERTRPPSYAY